MILELLLARVSTAAMHLAVGERRESLVETDKELATISPDVMSNTCADPDVPREELLTASSEEHQQQVTVLKEFASQWAKDIWLKP